MDALRSRLAAAAAGLEDLATPPEVTRKPPATSVLVRTTREAALATSLVEDAESLVSELLMSVDEILLDNFPPSPTKASAAKQRHRDRRKTRRRVDASEHEALLRAFEAARLRTLVCLLGATLRRARALGFARWRRAAAAARGHAALRSSLLRRAVVRRTQSCKRATLREWALVVGRDLRGRSKRRRPRR